MRDFRILMELIICSHGNEPRWARAKEHEGHKG